MLSLTSLLRHRNSDSKIFYNIIKRRRITRTNQTQVLTINGNLLSNPEHVAHDFAGHFEKLATPSSDNKYGSQYEELVSLDRLLIKDVCIIQTLLKTGVTPAEVMKTINSFKNNKAQVCRRLAAELLKFIPDYVSYYLAATLNYIMHTGCVAKS